MTTVMTIPDVEKMNKAPHLFVRFKSNDCGFCTESQPEWNILSNMLSNLTLNQGCLVREIESKFTNAFKGKNADGTAFVVNGVPAYEYFKHGKRVEMSPPNRDAKSLLKLLKKNKFIKQKSSRKSKRSRRKTRRMIT